MVLVFDLPPPAFSRATTARLQTFYWSARVGRFPVYPAGTCLPSRSIRCDSRRNRSRICTRVNRAGRCRWPASFLGDLPPPPPPHLALAPWRCCILTSLQPHHLKISLLTGLTTKPAVANFKWGINLGYPVRSRTSASGSSFDQNFHTRNVTDIAVAWGFSRGIPISPAIAFHRFSIADLTSPNVGYVFSVQQRVVNVRHGHQQSSNCASPAIPQRAVWLDYSLPPSHLGANWVRFPAWSLPDFRMWELCRTLLLVGGFSRGSPVCYALALWRCSIYRFTLIDSQDLYAALIDRLINYTRGSRPPASPFDPMSRGGVEGRGYRESGEVGALAIDGLINYCLLDRRAARKCAPQTLAIHTSAVAGVSPSPPHQPADPRASDS
ncbi:hypothetical protein PR048_010375 [Dryococelus australis]|uniref:Uncharacterized protein n=1 Tax=Dryococelus australis TaxID=614101 RepID=A0ABQ9I2K5_9NEOP|nr:hypothetical protein PR048_010375 [Dryococelus australis]